MIACLWLTMGRIEAISRDVRVLAVGMLTSMLYVLNVFNVGQEVEVKR